MPAESKAQRRFMAMVEHNPDASPAVAQAAKGMSKEQAHDFAATKEKGLPMHKGKHHKAHHGRGSDNAEGRRRNPRGNPY